MGTVYPIVERRAHIYMLVLVAFLVPTQSHSHYLLGRYVYTFSYWCLGIDSGLHYHYYHTCLSLQHIGDGICPSEW